MKKIPLNKELLEHRVSETNADLEKLRNFQEYSLDQFLEGENFAIAEHYLRRGLEAIFDIGNHILARLSIPPDERPSTYKDIARLLGKYRVVPKDFAENALLNMAGYRIRLVHFYHEIAREELYQIIRNYLKDIDRFCSFIVKIIKYPKRLNLDIK